MNRIVSFFKQFRLSQFFAVALAGFLMLSTAACAARSDVQARVPGTTFPKVASDAQGGMNDYSDTDPRVNTKPASDKAKALQDRVERNVNTKRIDSVDKYVDNYRSGTPLDERTERAAKGFGKAVEGVKDDAQDLGRTLSDKTQRNLDGTQRAAENVKENTKAAARDAAQDVKQAADRTANFAQDTADNTARSAQRSLDRASTPNRA